MKQQITMLGYIYIALSALGLLGGVIALLLIAGGGLLSGEEEAMVIMTMVGGVFACIVTAISLPGLIAGYGLIGFKPWARPLGMVLGVLNLFNLPLGTIVGIFTLYLLMQEEAAVLFESQGKSFS